MNRRSFIGGCTCGVVAQAWASHGQPLRYAPVLLADAEGQPLRAAQLAARTNYVFFYPFEATPALLLDLDEPAEPYTVSNRDGEPYTWPGGVGPRRSIVAYAAICPSQLHYPNRGGGFISFRAERARRGVQDDLIHCCAEHSQFDPARGARVLAGPALQPLAAILLLHDAASDTLIAYATLGGEVFEAFFRRHATQLQIDHGATARRVVTGRARVLELERYAGNPVQC